MIGLAKQPPATWALAMPAVGGVLALILTLLPTFIWQSRPAPTAPWKAIAIPAIEVPPYESYAAIAEHPLFSDGRRRDQPGGASQSGPPPLSNYRLAGVIISRDIRIALVERRPSKQIVTIHPGDNLDGRHVDDITDTGVRFGGANGAEFLTVPKGKSGGWNVQAPRQ